MLPEALKEHATAAAIEALDTAAIVGGKLDRNEVTLHIAPEKIASVCRFLKDTREFVRLVDVTAVDLYPQDPRFEIVYHLHSISRNERLRLKCAVASAIESVTSVWRGANWYEREVFDLFGVTFHNHPNLTRILMPEDWQGHPLRRDYPTHGYKYSYQNE